MPDTPPIRRQVSTPPAAAGEGAGRSEPTPRPAGDGTIAVRDGEAVDATRVAAYLHERVAGFPPVGLEVRQFPTGASNLTYLLRAGDWLGVLRRPPLGPVPPKAHDMVREGNLLRHLHPVFPLAPQPYAVCDDPAIIGAPFHVMEYRRGVVIDGGVPANVDATPEFCRQAAEAVVDTLVALHAVDIDATDLAELGRAEGFLERQVEGWIGRYERARTEDIPGVVPLVNWLREHRPASPPATMIHNDFKLNNLLFDPAGSPAVVAVLDWEMATVGDPLLDVAIFLSYWVEATDPPYLQSMLPSVSRLPGFPGRSELQRLYAQRSGRDLSDMRWYLTFAYFKLAVILQQIYARWVRGQTRDARFAGFGDAVRALISHAQATVD